MKININSNNIILLMKIGAILIFLGRAYQYLFWSAPFTTLMWDESLLTPIVEDVFNTPWHDYATSLTVDKWIKWSIKLNGALFVVAAICSAMINKDNYKFLKYPIFIGSIALMFLSFLLSKDRFFQYPMFLEHSIQFALPSVLLLAYNQNISGLKLNNILKVLIALTFVSHGIYAMGYFTVPGNFIDMTIKSIGVTENTAVIFLFTAGVLDIILSILIFIPRVSKYALWYAFFWGTITAMARITGHWDSQLVDATLHQYVYQMVYRIPHGLVPLTVYLLEYKTELVKKLIPSHI